ncbi:hypothetical protein AB834_06875 [PVC group bacterium (ex Bugula neritina AB1)]|nr:hypothetical protein AB834_06875 [PVC group bacterium (ex Bugula neritina AB1)]
MRYEFFLAWKYLRSRSRQNFITFISIMSILGVGMAVCSLIVVMAVMNGFNSELVEKFIGMDAHLTVHVPDQVSISESLLDELNSYPKIQSMSPQMSVQALIRSSHKARGVLVKGVNWEMEEKTSRIVESLKQEILTKNLTAEDGTPQVILGFDLAKILKVQVGDFIEIISPTKLMKRKMRGADLQKFQVINIFETNMYDLDVSLVYISLDMFEKMFENEDLDVFQYINILLRPNFQLEKDSEEIQKILPSFMYVSAWYDRNKNLLSALKLEKTAMIVILFLIIIVSAFNIANMLIMFIMDKTKEIGLLKALGAKRKSIIMIFSIQGSLIGIAGTALGFLLGLGLCALLKDSSWINLPTDVYYVNKLPVKINFQDTFWMMGGAMLICFVSTLYPAFFASKLDPVKALRYE